VSRVLELVPLDLRDASAFIEKHHRHHRPPRGLKFALAASVRGEIVGVATVGRPVARERQDGWTLEVTRLCTDGIDRWVDDCHKINVPSFLYSACARAAIALGYRRIGTYTLKIESGTSLVAAGWRVIHEVPGRSWSTKSRPRVDKHPTLPKLLWEPAV
jgi:hypothetical protein